MWNLIIWMLFFFDFKIRCKNVRYYIKLLLLYQYYCAFKHFQSFKKTFSLKKQNIEINIFVRFVFSFLFYSKDNLIFSHIINISFFIFL